MIRMISIVCVAVGIIVTMPASFGRGGGGGMHHAAMTAALHVDTPGTNSSGTALSASGIGSSTRGVSLGTNPAIAREDAAVARLVKGSICRGC